MNAAAINAVAEQQGQQVQQKNVFLWLLNGYGKILVWNYRVSHLRRFSLSESC
jgi:hypothetical protein